MYTNAKLTTICMMISILFSSDNVYAVEGFSNKQVTELDDISVDALRNTARYRYIDVDTSESATKTVVPTTQTPQSVQVVTRRHMDERAPQSIADTLNYTSGVSGGYRGENTHLEMSVRGIGMKSDGGASPIYWDGLAYSTPYEFHPYALEKIEVLKGPSSVLYGQVNPGGLVNLISKKPMGSNIHEIIVQTGSRKRIEFNFDIDKTLNEQIDYRFVVAAKQMDWQENSVRQQQWMLAPSITWHPSIDTDLTLLAFYEKQPKAGNRNFLPATGTVYAVDGKKIPRNLLTTDPDFHDLHNAQAHIGYQFQHRFNKYFILKQNLRYGDYQNYLKSLIVWGDAQGSIIPRKARISDEDSHEFQIDTRGEWSFDTGVIKHNLIGGVDYRYLSEHSIQYIGDAPALDWRFPIYHANIDTLKILQHENNIVKQTGFYVQEQAQIGQAHFLIGTRYDKASIDNKNYVGVSAQQHKDNKLTWKTGFIYNFSNGLSPYISYSTSFLPNAGVDAHHQQLKASTAYQYELGFKYQPQPSVLLTASVFDIKQKNLVVYDPISRDKSQMGVVETRGAEIEFQGDITPAWGLSGSYTYLDKKVKEDVDYTKINTIPWGIPKHSASLWTDYRIRKGIFNGLSMGAGVRYIGDTWGDNENSYKIPSYTLWDAKLAYQLNYLFPSLKGSALQLNFQNLTNKKYVSSCASTRKDACFYGKGRIVTLQYSYRW